MSDLETVAQSEAESWLKRRRLVSTEHERTLAACSLRDLLMQFAVSAAAKASEQAALHVERHSCVSSCCDAQPGANEAEALAECVRSHAKRVASNGTASWTIGTLQPPPTWGVFDTWDRRWCPKRGTEEEMGAHAVKLNRKAVGAHGVTVAKDADGSLTDSTVYRYQPLPLPGTDVSA